MRKLNYKLIVSDFDGTLIDSNQEVPSKVRSAINEYISCGGIFAVCTGRMLRSIMPRVRELGLKGLVVANQGTVIADIESEEHIKYGGFEYGDAAEICEVIEQLGQSLNAYCGDEIYTDIPKSNHYLQLYEKIVGVEATFVDGKLSDFINDRKLYCQKVAVLIAPSERDWLYGELKEKLGKRFDVTCSANVLVEVAPLGDTKGEAVKFLADRYGIPIKKTVAIGDNLNDLSMVEAAGIGVAVGNASEELKSAADFVSVTNDEGAVAQIIEKYGFE